MSIYIAEDEPLASAKLKLFLQKLGENGDIRIFDNGISLLAALQDEQPEVLFLDIQMPGVTGMQVLERMKEIGIKNTQIIITSAFDQYAIQSFGFSVTDYLLKPYTLDRLKQALEKAKTNIRLQALDKQVNTHVLTVRIDGRNVIIPTSEIVYLEALKDYVRIVTCDGQKRMTLGTMSSFETKLTDDFMRVHRSFIINLNHIQEYNCQTVTMLGKLEIGIGKTYREQFEKLLSQK